jgi:glycosyltransferase involved in cell wall biosynthesis
VRINFIVNEVFDGWEPTDQRLGGTEESVVQWAEILAHRGNEVTVYRNGRGVPPPPREGDDVSWVSYRERADYTGGGDVCINVKSSEIAPKEPTLYFTNETNASSLDLKAYRAVLWPSQWCIDNIPVNNPTTLVVPHGYDPTLIYPETKVPQQCLYASSPDRGLDTLLDAWPQVHAAHPAATLLLTYGGGAVDLPGAMNLGNVSETLMAELYRTSDIWCHPASGGELFCITGKKAQVAGCIPVIIPTMALSETVERGFKTDKAHYAQTLSEVLGLRPEYRDHIRQDVIAHANALTWEQSTDVLMAAITRVL